jgi:hypothetical protein
MQNSDSQMTLLDRFCREAKERVVQARDLDDAVRQKDALCERFEQECSSQLVINAAKTFVGNLLQTRWKQENNPEGP